MRSNDDTIPNLEDAVSGGFSEFKIGEKKFKESEQKKEETIEHSAVETNPIEKSEPKYGYKIDAVESRQSFVVKPNSATMETKQGLEITSPAEEERIAQEKARLEALAQQPQKPQQEVKDKPSSTIGDEFDVAW
ncbi:MAG: hypothetical protein OSB30_00800 [Candidatus Poseidoniaceae archaeon]|nr:hypothetical protein [Candidatus Poseidoniaceae archaeon]